jgi:hypothetical protein
MFAAFLILAVVLMWQLTRRLFRGRPAGGLELGFPATRRAARILWISLVVLFTVLLALSLYDWAAP